MKISIAQLNYHIGNFESNYQKIAEAIKKAKAEKSDLLIFSELALCGYPPRDFLEFEDFIDLCEEYLEKVRQLCTNIAVIIGAPQRSKLPKGKALFNAAYAIVDGKVASIHQKELLPTYDVFDEYRYFESGHQPQLFEYKGMKIAITICEDIWNVAGSYLYRSSPLEKLDQFDLVVNIAASPFSFNQIESRQNVFDYNIKKYEKPIIYVNHVGAQTELIFDGGSKVIAASNKTVKELAYFKEDYYTFELDTLGKETTSSSPLTKYERIEQALVLGVKDYFKKLGFKSATLGLSGGLDSALTLTIAVKALGAKNVKPILLPSQFSSDHSISDSIQLCKNLGCNYFQIPIESIFEAFDKSLDPIFKDLPFDIAEENIQSRIRGTILMAYGNKFRAILLNTSNKSELAVGYGTLYGDMAGGLSVIGDLYKTEAYELCDFINRNEEMIPKHILTKAPSAELRPDQKDSDSLPDYEILDELLRGYIENRKSPQQLIKDGFDEQIVKKVMRLVNLNEYKRHQTPPILRISEKAFGMGRRMPIVGKYLT